MKIEVTEEMRKMARAFHEADDRRANAGNTGPYRQAVIDTRYAAITLARLVAEAVEREEAK